MTPEEAIRKRLMASRAAGRDWWSANGTGWGAEHDQPNPFARALQRLKQDASEAIDDLRDEPSEVPYRIRTRLNDFIKGRTR